MLQHIIKVAQEIFAHKYPDASVIFLAGSIVRGEGTPFSDLDIVVIYDSLPFAFRESFYFQNFPVEAFVHDPETLNYFFTEADRSAGVPSLAQMVSEGIEIPQSNDLSQSLKKLAASAINLRPLKWSEEELRRSRYNITNLIDDIKQPRSKAELTASGTLLYEALAEHYFRANNFWSAKGKSIPRILEKTDAALYRHYIAAFEDLFVNGKPEHVIFLAEELLQPSGGFLFEGHRLDAPPNYRKPLE